MKLRQSLRTAFATLTLAVTTLILAVPAYASDEDATKDVIKMKTQHKWFYWPGWFFLIFTVVALLAVLYGWYRSVLGPKYRGRKAS
ncbi:MAG: hypothetical protein U0R17_07590 [Acidimicrobiia bacterium]